MTDEEVMRFVDGELGAERAARIEAALVSDAELGRRIDQHRALRATLAAAFDDVLSEAVPARLIAATKATANVTDLTAVRTRRDARSASQRPSAIWWTGIAASLVVGFVAGRQVVPSTSLLNPDAALARSLEGTASGAIQVALSYRDRAGRFCRAYNDRREVSVSGVACRTRAGWAIGIVAVGSPTQSSEYRTATTALPQPILAFVDATITGAPLDQAAEKAAARQSWLARPQ